MGANLGLIAGYDFGIPSKTVYTPVGGMQQTLTSSVQDFHVGARLRVPLSSTLGFGLNAAYGQQKYILKGDEAGPLVPDVVYSSIRVGADVRAMMGALFFEGRLGARIVLGTGELEKPDIWFKNVGGRAIEGGLTLGYQVTPMIAVLAGAEYLRYGFDFNPLNPNDPSVRKVAGGAIDQYMGAQLGARFTLPGSAAVTAASE